MASSTPQQGQDGAEQSRRPRDDRAPYKEDPSDDEKGKKKTRQRGPPRRQHKKPPRQRRAYSADDYYDYPTETQGTGLGLYSPSPRGYDTYSPNAGPFQQDASPWYPTPSPQTPSYPTNYPGSYPFPSDPNSYFPGPSRATPYSQPGPYRPAPNIQPQMEYHDVEFPAPDAYDPPPPPPPPPAYPDYPSRTPRRPQPRPLMPRQPASDPPLVMRGALPERQSKKKPSSRRRDSAPPSNDQKTLQVMGQVLDSLDNVRRQLEDRSSEVQSDPGRFWSRYPPGSATTSQYSRDETRERQERDHLVGIIDRLLEDRERQGYRNPFLSSQRNDIAAMIGGSLAGVSESDMNRALIRHGDDKEIKSKLDTILDLLVERRIYPSQPFQREHQEHRTGRQVPRGDPTVISITSSREPDIRRQVLQRRASVAHPPTGGRPIVQHQPAHTSNQSRVRQRVTRPPEPEDDELDDRFDEQYDLFGGYETQAQDSPVQERFRARRLSMSRDIDGSEAVSEQRGRRVLVGGEQRMRPRCYATVEDDDEDDDDEVPIPTRSSLARRVRVEGDRPVPPVPDAPVSVTGQRRRVVPRVVRFDGD
ncbi:hypothetical protein NW768_007416 [Fusarium equiseti]|uniref:BAG domain-containing protein n=1 Tax=Fusarium equiseti TaxID=61235 RepID=A0ABQ8R7K9_FUSEQ|nr:hypothetical protein NW768_007416 [Fusarium equiseti]